MTASLTFDASLSRAIAQRRLAQAFNEIGIETAALDARVLLCGALGTDHAGLVRDPDRPLGEAAPRLEGFAQRRLKHEPVSRILGRKEFFGEIYTIDSAVLDPRPDTETLVEAVLAATAPRKSEALRVLDLGVGSGAILGALLGQLEQATGFGVDLSPAACRRAQANLSAMGLAKRAFILAGNWMAPLRGRFDIIVANPPYIVSADIERLDPEVRFYDPRLALDGGCDGLQAYRAILAAVQTHLAPAGLLAFELGASQFSEVESMSRASGLELIGCHRDLAGRERVLLAMAGRGR